MKTLSLLAYPLVATLSLAAAGTAMADDITPDTSATQVFAQPATRAQVQADLAAVRRDGGSFRRYSNGYDPLAAVRSTKSRADVRAEPAANWNGEDSGSFAMSRS